ncbi:MAG: FHA domain-containing protein [Burkholderiaceae bacterium]
METLALIELLDRDGQARQATRVSAWPVRIGRALDSDVVLDDPHVAAHHLELVEHDGAVQVVPASTINGVRVGRATVAAGTAATLPASGLLHVGPLTLRVRLASSALAPEQRWVDPGGGRRRAAWLLALALLAAAWAGFDLWLSSVPGESGTAMTGMYLAAPLGLGIWCGLWALVSKIFQRQFAFWPHLEAALFWPLLATIVEAVCGQAAFALSMPVLAKAGHVLAIAALAMLLWRHLSIVQPTRRRAFGWILVGVVAVVGGLNVAERVRHQQPLVGGLYLGTISLPGMRLAKPESADAFVQSAAPLQKSLARWAKKGDDEEQEGASDDD